MILSSSEVVCFVEGFAQLLMSRVKVKIGLYKQTIYKYNTLFFNNKGSLNSPSNSDIN